MRPRRFVLIPTLVLTLTVKVVLGATLTITEVKTVITPDEPVTASESHTYVTTTILHYAAPTTLTELELYHGGIDLIPFQMMGSLEKMEVHTKTQKENHHSQEDSSDATLTVASPYHLSPGYRGDESPEERAKIEPERVVPPQVPINASLPDVSTEPAVPTPTVSEPTHSGPLPSNPRVNPVAPRPAPVSDESTIVVDLKDIQYEEKKENAFARSPLMDDGELSELELKWERLPDRSVLDSQVKEPYKNKSPGKRIPPPVSKIMTDDAPSKTTLSVSPTGSNLIMETHSSSKKKDGYFSATTTALPTFKQNPLQLLKNRKLNKEKEKEKEKSRKKQLSPKLSASRSPSGPSGKLSSALSQKLNTEFGKPLQNRKYSDKHFFLRLKSGASQLDIPQLWRLIGFFGIVCAFCFV